MVLEDFVLQWYMLALPMAAAFVFLFRLARRLVLPSADWMQVFSAAAWLAFGFYDVYMTHVVFSEVSRPIRPEAPTLALTLSLISTASVASLVLAVVLLRDIPIHRRRSDPPMV